MAIVPTRRAANKKQRPTPPPNRVDLLLGVRTAFLFVLLCSPAPTIAVSAAGHSSVSAGSSTSAVETHNDLHQGRSPAELLPTCPAATWGTIITNDDEGHCKCLPNDFRVNHKAVVIISGSTRAPPPPLCSRPPPVHVSLREEARRCRQRGPPGSGRSSPWTPR